MAAVNPYEAYKSMYDQRTKAIEAQTKQAELEKSQREQQAQQTLANSNRGVYTTYKNAINPYGSFASQNNFSSGVSDYYKNASYGTMLQGLGTNQYNYNDAMNNSNSLWQNYLAQKAGNEADALTDYNNAVIGQQKYDEEQRIAEAERQEAIRQFNLNVQLKQEAEKAAQARWEAEQAESKRRYDQEWAYQMEQAAKASSGGSSGGSSYRSYTPAAEEPTDNGTHTYIQDNYTTKGAQDTSKSVSQKTTTKYAASGVAGKMYKITYDAKTGKEISRTLVKLNKSLIK